LFPESLDEYISAEVPLRAYDAFVEALDIKTSGINWDTHKVCCTRYDPKLMLKILIYGYSYGIGSSRRLERAFYLEKIRDEGLVRLNSTDPESAPMQVIQTLSREMP
jgi:transposase